MARELMRAAAIVAFACKLLSGSPYASQRRFSRRLNRLLTFKILDAFERSSLEGGRVTSDQRLDRSLNMWDPTIDAAIRLPQLLDELTSRDRRHRFRGAPYRSVCDRNTFHTSPHFVHLQ